MAVRVWQRTTNRRDNRAVLTPGERAPTMAATADGDRWRRRSPYQRGHHHHHRPPLTRAQFLHGMQIPWRNGKYIVETWKLGWPVGSIGPKGTSHWAFKVCFGFGLTSSGPVRRKGRIAKKAAALASSQVGWAYKSAIFLFFFCKYLYSHRRLILRYLYLYLYWYLHLSISIIISVSTSISISIYVFISISIYVFISISISVSTSIPIDFIILLKPH